MLQASLFAPSPPAVAATAPVLALRPDTALTAGEASDLLTATIARATWAKARRGGR